MSVINTFACDVVFSQLKTIGDADTISQTFDWYTNDGLIRNEIDFGKVYHFDNPPNRRLNSQY